MEFCNFTRISISSSRMDFINASHSLRHSRISSGLINVYSDRHYLAYCVNNFLRPWESRYYKERGVEVDNDSYGLSFLIQWVFRSAIRNGEEIWVYIPSARMRSLFTQWLDNLADGNDLNPVTYKVPRKNHYVKKKNADL